MTNELGKSSELVSRAISLVKQDIEINKKLLGIDFSYFLGTAINIISKQVFAVATKIDKPNRFEETDTQFRITDSERMRNLFVSIQFGIAGTARALEEQFQGKKVIFFNTLKAITAIGLIRACDCYDELEKIENFVQELMSADGLDETNHKATDLFFKSIK
jgi:prenyltransferase beta subunit